MGSEPLTPGATEVVGAITWEYQEAETGTIVADDRPLSGPIFIDDFAELPIDPLVGMVRVDARGRWRSLGLDETGLTAEERRAFDEALQAYDRNEAEDALVPEGDRMEAWYPMSWTHFNCNSPPTTVSNPNDAQINAWGSQSYFGFNSISANRHFRTVLIQTSTGGTCSGVVIDNPIANDDRVRVLTAAHCVMPGTQPNRPHNICSRGNHYPGADCITDDPVNGGLFDVTVSSGWAAGIRIPKHDYALVSWYQDPQIWTDSRRLTGTGTGTGATLSNHTDSQLETVQLGHYGHPILNFWPTCADTDDGDEVETYNPDQPPPFFSSEWTSRKIFFEWRNDHNFVGSVVKTKLDGVGGFSGGPFWSRPAGSPNYLLSGLFVGSFNSFFGGFRTGGPRSSQMLPLVLAN